MNTYIDKDTTEVFDTEHIAFLAFWFSQYVLCTRSLQLPRSYVIMAIQLHEGHSFCLRKLLLGHLHDSMRIGCQTMKNITDKKTLNLAGSWWLFQLRVVATFQKPLWFLISAIHDKEFKQRRTEEVRLTYLSRKSINRTLVEIFLEYFDVFSSCDTFERVMAPFIDRKHVPKWFQRIFPTEESIALADNVEIWRNYLTLTFLLVRITNGKTDYKAIGYLPPPRCKEIWFKPTSSYFYSHDPSINLR